MKKGTESLLIMTGKVDSRMIIIIVQNTFLTHLTRCTRSGERQETKRHKPRKRGIGNRRQILLPRSDGRSGEPHMTSENILSVPGFHTRKLGYENNCSSGLLDSVGLKPLFDL